jgi:hypothetical protein
VIRAPWAGVALLALAALSCGSDRGITRPTAPTTPGATAGIAAGTTLTVIRGDTSAPVQGATVTIAGQAYTTDGAGAVRVDQAAALGALVDVVAPSILDRQTVVRARDSATVVVWPRATPSGVDEGFTANIVYTRVDVITGTGPAGGEPLRRLATPSVVVVPAPEFLDDERAHAAHLAAIARINEAARGAVTYVLARERPATGVAFVTRFGPTDASCRERILAFTRSNTRAQEIQGGEIVFCTDDGARLPDLIVHELGHTFGMFHSTDPRDMMFGTFIRNHATAFREREADTMALMLKRRAGNRFPDSDRGVAGASVGEDVIVCR